mmetsp:Transcript_20662/g.36858  ORF Transcript_20662/g.36858 Transcript_20662/m.36858 type:complete len:202 (-) Transcript_20662:128-733(-)
MQVLHDHLRHFVVCLGEQVLLRDLVDAVLLAHAVQGSRVKLLALRVTRLHHRPPQLGLHRVESSQHAILDISIHANRVELLHVVTHAAITLRCERLFLSLYRFPVLLSGGIQPELLPNGSKLSRISLNALNIRLLRNLQSRGLFQQGTVSCLLLLKDVHKRVSFSRHTPDLRSHQLRPGQSLCAASRTAKNNSRHRGDQRQ